MCVMPESPRFLMGQGRNSEALLVLQKIYQINTGQPKDNYPVGAISNYKKKYLQLFFVFVFARWKRLFWKYPIVLPRRTRLFTQWRRSPRSKKTALRAAYWRACAPACNRSSPCFTSHCWASRCVAILCSSACFWAWTPFGSGSPNSFPRWPIMRHCIWMMMHRPPCAPYLISVLIKLPRRSRTIRLHVLRWECDNFLSLIISNILWGCDLKMSLLAFGCLLKLLYSIRDTNSMHIIVMARLWYELPRYLSDRPKITCLSSFIINVFILLHHSDVTHSSLFLFLSISYTASNYIYRYVF